VWTIFHHLSADFDLRQAGLGKLGASAAQRGPSTTQYFQGGKDIADSANRSGPNPVAIAVIGLAVVGYLYFRDRRDEVKIDLPGFEGTTTKGEGVDIKVGKD
jgi:hypothetical protein